MSSQELAPAGAEDSDKKLSKKDIEKFEPRRFSRKSTVGDGEWSGMESIKAKNPFVIRPAHTFVIKSGLQGVVFLMNNLVNAYAKSGSICDARELFDHMPVKDISSYNTILSAYAKRGMIREAICVFNEIPSPDSISWTTMIVGYNRFGRLKAAFRMFSEMVKLQVTPSEYTFTNIIASCAAIRALDIGRNLHSLAVKFGFSGHTSVSNSLVNMYAKSGDAETAGNIADRIESKDVSTWNSIISLHMEVGQVDRALAQFVEMRERDVISWNSMISGYHFCGFDSKALKFFFEMLRSDIKPDTYTIATVLSACGNLNDLGIGKQIHGYIVRNELFDSEAVGNALICMYSKCGGIEIARKCLTRTVSLIAFTALLDGYLKSGDINPARQIFDSLQHRDVVACTAMIVGCMQNGDNGEAMEIFRDMVDDGPSPNGYTFAAVLSVSSNLASLNHGRQIHAASVKFGLSLSLSVSNSLISMYSKAGSIGCSRRAFESIRKRRDPVSWTSMIVALAQHGFGEEALRSFEEMLASNIPPDHVTYVGVLSACAHAGLVDEGRRYFRTMTDVHGIEPSSSHSACMVDLFGRAGMFAEARRFIQGMATEPDVVVWGSLLSSCRVHKNAELAAVAAERLLGIDPGNGGAYSALANVYSACRRWGEAARVRKAMKEREVRKEQGMSWLEVKDEVRIFGAHDVGGYHPEGDRIYAEADRVWEEIKRMGFVPDAASVLHDVDADGEDGHGGEAALKYHSEKLAIAFGLLSTPEGSVLRIMKNLRVCNDCHSAAKFISKLVGREIVVRDATRFHHFRDGSCSCRDYW
ncbi:hypothetical protein M569_13595 [Genlisea aurea]|uniref:DYW domain-containing protein n=1 Tax=Genlisea aurea TaxID=192259 RepID=S8C3F9_9LAMI|nr:hypothetical protein M569_13595 [Genlisea aurea]